MLRLKDLMRPEPVDAKAPEESDEVKYRRHRRRTMDEQPDEALNMQQRLQRARAFRRNRSKIKIGRERAKRRFASKEVLKKRARRAARNMIVQKLTKGMSKDELTFARRQEIEKRLDKMGPRINKLAMKLLPKLRKAEAERKRGGKS
mgnify:CR=1 FL=1